MAVLCADLVKERVKAHQRKMAELLAQREKRHVNNILKVHALSLCVCVCVCLSMLCLCLWRVLCAVANTSVQEHPHLNEQEALLALHECNEDSTDAILRLGHSSAFLMRIRQSLAKETREARGTFNVVVSVETPRGPLRSLTRPVF